MRRNILLLLLVALAGLTLVPTGRAQDEGGGWPFGTGGGPSMRGLDLYNLGLLGAKAADPVWRPQPLTQGRRQSSSADAPKYADAGPEHLKVHLLFPGGPAETAGLQVGDVIVGAPKSFKEGSIEPLAASLRKVESGKSKGVLSLRIEREGEKKTLTIDVPIPQGGKSAAKPHAEPHRQVIVDAGLAWLAERQDSLGGYPQTLSGANGAVCMASLAGLAWLAGGSDLENGPYKENVAKAAEFVAASLPAMSRETPGTAERTGPSWDQSNWGYAHAAIFLGELFARTPTDAVGETLRHCGEELAGRQEASGGWAHGPGGPNALGYLELNIVTGLALCGLGLSRAAGFEVPGEVIEKAAEYLSKFGSGDGGVSYSHKGGQAGSGNIGRTAVSWLGMRTLGQGKAKWTQKMGNYVKSHAGESMQTGHASLMQHFFLAGVAAHAQGKEARKRYWETALDVMTLARAPDGSFQPRPWHETLGMGSNSDVSFGDVWTTAAWTIVLACEPTKERPGLPAWMGLETKK